jgi:recombination protein RecT
MEVTTNNQAIRPAQTQGESLRDYFEANKHKFADVLPRHLTAERLAKVALLATSRDQKLAACSPLSLLKATMEAAAVGLEPNTPLQHAWLIPYYNSKTRVTEVQLQIGYRGLVELSRRSGEIKSISANVVREADVFEYEEGLDVRLRHVPNLTAKDRGEIRLVYAIAHFRDGGHQHDVMTIDEIETIRKKSKSPDYGPWKDHFAEMAKKTVLKRLCKLLPMAIEAATAIEADDADTIEVSANNNVITRLTEGFEQPAMELPPLLRSEPVTAEEEVRDDT